MPRRRKVQVKNPAPDPVYKSRVVSKLINKVLMHGKKSTATKVVYDAIKFAAEQLKIKDALEVFETAVKNVTPLIEVRSKRIGGGNYQIPVEVKPHRRESLALRWLVRYSRDKKGIPMHKALGQEIADAYNKTGAAHKKKEETHKMAESNRAFAHYARYGV